MTSEHKKILLSAVANGMPYASLARPEWPELAHELETVLGKAVPEPPFMKYDQFGDGVLACPFCERPVMNYCNRTVKVPHCMFCGQALEWEEDSRTHKAYEFFKERDPEAVEKLKADLFDLDHE